jgi:hypothetical protein
MISYFHVKYFHEAVAALPFPGTEYVYTGGDDLHYWRQFRDRWIGINDLFAVEQDIVITPEVIDGFAKCPEPWCVYPYGSLTESLGCTRFRKELQRKVPSGSITNSLMSLPSHDFGKEVKYLLPLSRLMPTRNLACEYCTSYGVCWRHLDVRVAGAVKEKGFTVCIHEPSVRHLH